MLSYLKVENFAVVEKVELDFSENLNILTGETGTGKSILIDALGLFLKKKILKSSVRSGNNQLVVEAMFTLKDDEFVLRRELNGSGKQKVFSYINGKMVPFVQLKEVAEKLLSIYGQQDHTFLLNISNHRLFLDNFSKNRDLLGSISGVYIKLKQLINEVEDLKEKNRRASEKLDFINFQISEIEDLKIEAGDDAKLEQRLKILSSSEEIISKSTLIIQDSYQKDKSIYNIMAENLKNLDYLEKIYPELSSFKTEIYKFYNLLPEFSSTLSNIIGQVEYNEDELDEIEQKLMKLNRLKSKYKVNLEELFEKLEDLKRERESLLNMDLSIKEKQNKIEKLLVNYKKINKELRRRRKEKSTELSSLIEQEIAKLEMKKAKFIVKYNEIQPDLNNISQGGTDEIEFYFSPNPGQEPGQIKNVASGGELSRLMLVLKSIIRDEVYSTFIFDEIDSGIGGKTAEFVGEKLKKIAKTNQVICISHLPQIASFADKHFLITKEFKNSRTYSYASELSEKEKVTEIARLMAGSAVNNDVLKAAENLLAKNNR